MPRTYTCTFCMKEFSAGYGMMYVKNDGTILRFCSSKCRRSMIDLKRDPRKLKWTNRYVKKAS
ncbi:MAG: 50S ribosomal protein L24e [Candidatus Bathyarchaeota archaeon]|nr:MAG: 50S ribosomal protein L24e [Candidatus Bathyarchaeota archaeon]